MTIYEGTTVTEIAPGRCRTRPRHGARAPIVLRATEGFTASLRGQRRTLAADEQLDDRHRAAARRRLGGDRLGGAELLGDAATPTSTRSAPRTAASRSADAACRTATARAPTAHGQTQPRTDRAAGAGSCTSCSRAARRCRSSTPGAACWACRATGARPCGSTARRGLGWAGGYVGARRRDGEPRRPHAARPRARARPRELTALPWVGHRARRWEPEPLRWLGSRLVYGLYRAADRREARGTLKNSALAHAADLISGR